MKRVIVFFSLFLLANSHHQATIELEAYIAQLVELTVIRDEELLLFADHLDKDELVNPIDCQNLHCTSIQALHYDTLEEHIDETIDRTEIKEWAHTLLKKRGIDHKRREITKDETKHLWKGIPQRISAGFNHACAVNKDQKAVCWGTHRYDKNQVPKNLGPISQISVGNSHTCVLEESGAVQCFYGNQYRRSYAPSSASFVQVSTRGDRICTLEDDGNANCWYSINSNRTTVPSNLGLLSQISTGVFHGCGLSFDGQAKCWGPNSWVPMVLAPLLHISASEAHNCALAEAGSVVCWGGVEGESSVPSDLGPVVQVSSGDYYTCALKKNGEPKCWGSIPDKIKTELASFGPLVQIASSQHRICVLKQDAKVECLNWGTAAKISPPNDLEVYIEDLNSLSKMFDKSSR